jgi:hypothetical protein
MAPRGGVDRSILRVRKAVSSPLSRIWLPASCSSTRALAGERTGHVLPHEWPPLLIQRQFVAQARQPSSKRSALDSQPEEEERPSKVPHLLPEAPLPAHQSPTSDEEAQVPPEFQSTTGQSYES